MKLLSLAASIAAVWLLAGSVSARAGLTGQPKLPADAAARIRSAAAAIVGTGDLGTARPGLYIAVEDNVTADLADLLATVVRDDVTYNGLADTFESAVRAKTGDDQRFALYNLARLHLLRARVTLRAAAKQAVLAQAERTARRVTDTASRDAAAWELLGDIYAEQGNPEQAQAAYERINRGGAPGAMAQAHLKIGVAYQRAGRLELAEAAYRRGISADNAAPSKGGETLHRLYQNVASLYVQRGKYRDALDALSRSARVAPDASAPYRLRLDVAQALLARGYAREVLAYAEAALRVTPDDPAARDLRDAARGRIPQR